MINYINYILYLLLLKKGLLSSMKKIDGNFIEPEVLSLVHSQAYLDKVEAKVGMDEDQGELIPVKRNRNSYTFQYDTYENMWTKHCAKLSAGSVIELADAMMMGSIKAGFAIVRPPGHHAHSEYPAGFCFYNNVALAAKYLNSKIGAKICIFDWDVHFGDGTSSIFLQDPSVLFISIHRYQNGKFYPGGKGGDASNIGEGDGKGYNINIPFDEIGMGDDEYIYVCEKLLFPIIQEFNPEYILISAGFDSAEGDPLGGFKLTPIGYAYMTQRLMDICPKIISVLEGGYNIEMIANCAEGVVRVLQGQKLPIEEINAKEEAYQQYLNIKPQEEAIRVVSNVSEYLKDIWSCTKIPDLNIEESTKETISEDTKE